MRRCWKASRRRIKDFMLGCWGRCSVCFPPRPRGYAWQRSTCPFKHEGLAAHPWHRNALLMRHSKFRLFEGRWDDVDGLTGGVALKRPLKDR